MGTGGSEFQFWKSVNLRVQIQVTHECTRAHPYTERCWNSGLNVEAVLRGNKKDPEMLFNYTKNTFYYVSCRCMTKIE